MSEVELILLNSNDKCTVYTIQFVNDDQHKFDEFVSKFRDDTELNPDFRAIVRFIEQVVEFGALERYFRREGTMRDSVVALPALKSHLRLYCLRLTDQILVLGNGGAKKSRTYQEDDSLRGYVLTLQKFEELLKEGQRDGTVSITSKTIEINRKLDI